MAAHGNEIVEFLQGKIYFVTGATGLLAKGIVEKILRAIPNVERIYLLIKAKNKDVAMERLRNEIIDSQLFKSLKEIHGRSYEAFMMRKLVAVVGNVSEDDLGIDADTATQIAKQVHFIINSAAITKFDERYDIALNTNTLGPVRLLNFANKCQKLKLFVHISTVYVSGKRRGVILEKALHMEQFPLLDVDAEIKFVSQQVINGNNSSTHSLLLQQNIMKQLGAERARMYGWNNTYEFTKAMGEIMVTREKGNIPVIIVRPSIIESTYSEPFSGWIEGYRMLDPILISYGNSQLPSLFADPNTVLDIVPLDMVVNASIVAMAKHGMIDPKISESAAEPKVYHVASSVANPVSCGNIFEFAYDHFTSSPFLDSKGNKILINEFKFFRSIDKYISYMRETLSDQQNTNCSSQTESNRRLKQSIQLADTYQPYGFQRGWFDNNNIKKLIEVMSFEEKKLFGFDVESINWKHYLTNIHLSGLRRHVIKQKAMAAARL